MSMEPTASAGPQSASPGPKGGGADVRGALLAAGAALYESHGLGAVSLREVAARAGVNQAMVGYYFKDKQGFVAALMDHGFDRLFAAVPEGAAPRAALEAMIGGLNRMPWLTVLMTQSVYFSAELRGHFVHTHVPRIVALLGPIAGARTGGRRGRSAYGILTVISLLVFPQLARPVVGPVLGIGFDDEFARGFADHIMSLFESMEDNRD